MDFLPGAMIGGKYRLERKIAEGGVGEVWIAVDQKSRRVAIKRLLPDTAKDRELVARFRREAVLLGKLHSEYVSQVIEQISDSKFGMIIVMEYVDGEALADLLDKRIRLPIPEVIAIGIDIARAIGVLHEANIIHRDLKPENVILRRLSGGGTKAVLIDFGFARLDPHGQGKRPNDDALTGITRADTMLGTVAYMAPEQVLNSRDVGRLADVYALGAILYRAVSGRHVFGDLDDVAYARAKLDGEAPPLAIDRINAMSATVAKIIMRALKRRPADRFDRIETMLKELETARTITAADDADAPTQSAPVSSLLGANAAEIVKVNNKDGATSQTDRVVVNVGAVSAPPEPSPPPAAAPGTHEESSVTRPRQVGVQTIPIQAPIPIAPPPMPLPAAGQPPPSLRLAPPPVPPKLPPAPLTPGLDEDLPAHLRATAHNRPVVAVPPAAPGVDDDVPAHLRNTAKNRALPAQMPRAIAEGAKKNASGGISFGAAIASMTITLIAGLIAGWIVRSTVLGVSPLEMPPAPAIKR
jgi:eukaryotic-like serine/threonine-protein kinase